jgi:hypothetical protein
VGSSNLRISAREARNDRANADADREVDERDRQLRLELGRDGERQQDVMAMRGRSASHEANPGRHLAPP